jgi:regulator of replication initiation timing
VSSSKEVLGKSQDPRHKGTDTVNDEWNEIVKCPECFDELDRLRAEVVRLRDTMPALIDKVNDDLIQENERLRAENESLRLYKSMAEEFGLCVFEDLAELKQEMERWQHVKAGFINCNPDPKDQQHGWSYRGPWFCGPTLEAGIDAAIARESK